MAEPSVSLERAAELLGVTKRTIYNRIASGRLHTVRVGTTKSGGDLSQRVLVSSLPAAVRLALEDRKARR